MKKDLEKIKKLYGEDFAKKFCRPYFSHIIEREDFSFADFLTSIIAPSKFFYEDLVASGSIESFKNALYGSLNNNVTTNVDIKETPEELMKKAGYTLYKCETNEDLEQFKKYYAYGEMLCTFNDPDRIKTHTIFWAVKDNADEIKRERNPRRQDNYGTSVISIQFTKGIQSTLSIKNRYNHTVEYCDSTFSNDLENIYAGLTDSFEKYYGIQLVNGGQKFEVPGYVVDDKGCYYKSLYEIENIHYCLNNVIIANGKSTHYDPSRYIIADYYIIDRKNKTIDLLKNSQISDYFVYQFGTINKIDIENLGNDEKLVVVNCSYGDVGMKLNKYNQIIEFYNNNLVEIADDYMSYLKAIKKLSLLKVEEVGDNFLIDNESLEEFNAPNVKKFGERAFSSNKNLKYLQLENVKEFGDFCLFSNKRIKKMQMPKLESVGYEFMFDNESLESFEAPKLKTIQKGFFRKNNKMTRFYAPKLNKKYYEFLNEHMLELKNQKEFKTIIEKLIKKIRNDNENTMEGEI